MTTTKAAHAPDLLPCPFCGSTDLTLDHLVDDDDWFVSCKICEIQQIANYPKAQAVALWNKRPAAPDLLAAAGDVLKLVEALMPGLKDIAIQDYSLLNAPGKLAAAISRAEGRT